MKKRWIPVLFGGAAYLFLLRLLVLAESAAPGGTITGMDDALWFSLVTLTTAGYGDLYPVTPGGRAIGVVFLLLSTGFLAMVMAAALSLVTGRLLPWLRLRLAAGRFWYIFPALNRESAALAAALFRERPGAALVFCGAEEPEAAALLAGVPWYRGDRPLADLLRERRENALLVALGPDSRENYALALSAAEAGIPACCQSDLCPGAVPAGLTLFDRWESCARLYWRQRPLRRGEGQVVLVGEGRCAAALLCQALLVNLRDPRQRVAYHLVGDWGDFRRSHPFLDAVLAVGEPGAEGDSLLFHPGPWNADPALLAGADRVILCGDSDEENLAVLRELTRWFAVPGRVEIRLSAPLPGIGAAAFGSDDELFTPDLVLRTRLSRLAAAMHGIYRRSAESAPRWEELDAFLRRSNLAAADHLPVKLGLLLGTEELPPLTPALCRDGYRRWLGLGAAEREVLRELEHLRWMRFYALHGWRYAEKRDNPRRLHPDLRPYGELAPAERAKDDYAWELLAPLAEELEREEQNQSEGAGR